MADIVATLGPKSFNDTALEFLNNHASILRLNGSWIDLKQIKDLRSKTNLPILMDIPGNREKINKSRSNNLSDDELIDIAINLKFNYLGLSYAKNARDIINLKNKIGSSPIGIIVKIETSEAISNLVEIIAEGELFLIDRGDLGTAIGYENVPKAQLNIINEIKKQGKKVIVATEMLMSTLNNIKPSCADVSDVYYAIKQGANYVMLSEETAIGDPIKAVNIMNNIINSVKNETVVFTFGAFDMLHPGHIRFLQKAKNLGDKLVVGLVENEAIKELKGSNRPIQNFDDRHEILSSIKFIDNIYSMSTYDPVPLMKNLDIDILTKGDDWDIIPGEVYAKNNNIQVVKIKYSENYSTSDQLEKIQKMSSTIKSEDHKSESERVLDQIKNKSLG